jgi:salicylate hydroxylase
VLSVLLPKIRSREEIPDLLRIFEKARKERAENIVEGAYQNGKRMHMSEEESAERDKAFEAVKQGGENPDATASRQMQGELGLGLSVVLSADLMIRRLPLWLRLHGRGRKVV